jgi:signal transduction histidine kinase
MGRLARLRSLEGIRVGVLSTQRDMAAAPDFRDRRRTRFGGSHMTAAPMSSGAEADRVPGRRGYAADLFPARADQQAAVACLGLEALGGGPLQTLLEHASLLLAEALDVELTQILQLLPDEDALRLRAGVGWRPGLVGEATIGLDQGSPAGVALACDETVVVTDLAAAERFRAPALLRAHGAVSGINVVIHGRDRPWGSEPWGVLGAYSLRPRTFAADAHNFLGAVANTLALAIERDDAGHALERREREMFELAQQVTSLAEDRHRILVDALEAEDRARERISQLLHDGVLQSLLTVRQDLAKAETTGSAGGDFVGRAREGVVEAISELRNAVLALHPVALERGGLPSAIEAISTFHARRSGFALTLDLAPWRGGVCDQLIVSLAQELLNNVAKHAEAKHVTVALRRAADEVVFEVADDGRGMAPGRAAEALDQGHIGLASIARRVESEGGRVKFATSSGGGTCVRTVLPAAAEPC